MKVNLDGLQENIKECLDKSYPVAFADVERVMKVIEELKAARKFVKDYKRWKRAHDELYVEGHHVDTSLGVYDETNGDQ